MNADPPAFVDTNVLVYAFDTSDPRRQIARDLLARLLDEDRLRLSTQVLQEFYVTVTRKIARPLAPGEALKIMDDFASWPVVQLDYPLIREAVLTATEAQLSFWDGLIAVAARRADAALLYTEDLNHGQEIRGVKVVDPFRRP